MRIFAEHTIDKERKMRIPPEHLEKQTQSDLTLSLLRFLEGKINVEVSEDEFTETRRVELVVLSKKDVQEIGEIVSSFASYAKSYPAINAVQDKLNRIEEILLGETLQSKGVG